MSGEAARRAGQVLDGRYKLVERLGRGGFGDVWRAEELLPDGAVLREVALKLLRTHAGADWSAEARIIASLRHQALVTIYAAGVLELEASVPFVAMELLIGSSLETFVEREQRVPWRRVLSWAREAAAALDEIHRAGVVHLDLKPANLFLPEAGGLKVLDFGIARQGMVRGPVGELAADRAEDDMSTAAFIVARKEGQADTSSDALAGATSHSVVGTPGFMAPEIFEDGEATPASDAYALAGVIFQLTTGKLPQRVSTRPQVAESTTMRAWFAELQAATVRGQIRDIADEASHLPLALVALLERWLTLDPVARGVERGSLREALDEVWACPRGHQGNPYRGLKPYRLEDEGRLFGRDGDVARIARELCDQPCVIMHGEAGVGLSSLAHAGVVPALVKSFPDGRHEWRCCTVSLREDATPNELLHRALDSCLDGDGQDWLERLRRSMSGDAGVVVVIDDLQRLGDASVEDRSRVVALIEMAAEAASGLRVICTLRVDGTSELLKLEDVGRILRPWLRFISPLQASMVSDIVCGPARAAEHELVGGDTIAQDLQEQLGADGIGLALISMALHRWWSACDGGTFDAAVWVRRGGLMGFVREHADDVFGTFSSSEGALADSLMLRLINVDGTVIEVAQHELLGIGGAPTEVAAVLERLIAARLMNRVGGMVRLGHPELADWPRLHDLRLHDMDRLSFLEELRDANRRWVLAGRPKSQVWPAAKLKELARRGDLSNELNEDECCFLDASQRARRLDWLVRGLVVALVLASVIVVAWFDMQQDRRAQRQVEQIAAEQRTAAVARMVTRSRRTPDPYRRVALLTGAVAAGSVDPLLPLELAEAARELPSARFLSLEGIREPALPWGERFLIGGAGSEAAVLDFEPPAGADFGPTTIRFRPHSQGMLDYVPIVFDRAFVTRGLSGRLKVWRLRAVGELALVAVSPMKCVGGLSRVLVARRAPVIACTTANGVALWDLRDVDRVQTDPFVGSGLHLSPDGNWLAAARLRKVLLWSPSAKRRHEFQLDEPPSVGRFSDRGAFVAFARGYGLEVFDFSGEPRSVLSRKTGIRSPTAARWSASGVDLAVCSHGDRSEWHYLRQGGRSDQDPEPSASGYPCRANEQPWPQQQNHVSDYGDLGHASLGPRDFAGGWRRKNGQLMTRDLVVFDQTDQRLKRLVRRSDTVEGGGRPGESAAAVFRDGDQVVWQVGELVRVHDAAGKLVMSKPGRLLMRCPDGRLLAYRQAAGGREWELFGARHDVLLARLKRTPAMVLAADPACNKVFVQQLDGTLSSVSVVGGGKMVEAKPVAMPGGSWVAEGYIFDARPSRARGDVPAGVWMASSDGALLRANGSNGGLRAYGHATPRATAMADGPEPGDLIFADDTGLILRRTGHADERLLKPMVRRTWSDIAMLPGNETMLVAWAHGVVLYDLERREIVGDLDTPAHGRLAPWDAQGSQLVWAFSFMRQPQGQVIPFNRELALRIGETVSNLRAVLGPDGVPAVVATN